MVSRPFCMVAPKKGWTKRGPHPKNMRLITILWDGLEAGPINVKLTPKTSSTSATQKTVREVCDANEKIRAVGRPSRCRTALAYVGQGCGDAARGQWRNCRGIDQVGGGTRTGMGIGRRGLAARQGHRTVRGQGAT